jgi:pimeloyl-ACP methyl ester carboxylesterase
MAHLNSKLTILFLMCFCHLVIADPILKKGVGNFKVQGGEGRENLIIGIDYYIPENFSVDSPILIVLPGNGRTGGNYRDRWMTSSDKYSTLILSLTYSKALYPKSANYNLARMVTKKEAVFTKVNDPAEWIFEDFDRIFDLVVASTKFSQLQYDFFGHSAGAQIGHRLAIFSSQNKVNRIVAANSGWYTVTDFGTPFPYGLSNSPIEESIMKTKLEASFAKKLIVFLGEKDNAKETKGHLFRDVESDKQGMHRFERGQYFFRKSKELASQLGYKFNWELQVIPNVGHSSTKMSPIAADFLYAQP